jgi:hypothetical protein
LLRYGVAGQQHIRAFSGRNPTEKARFVYSRLFLF